MQRNSKAKLSTYRLSKIDFSINPGLDVDLTLKLSEEYKFRPPVDPTKKSILLEITSTIDAQEDEEFILIIESEFIFELDVASEDVEEVVKDACVQDARMIVIEAFKNITKIMGINPVDFSNAVS